MGRLAPGRRAAQLAPWLLLAALLVTWTLWYPQSPDLAAQSYRVHLFSADGFSLWDNGWYGGHYLPGYSLIFPPLATLLGMRATGAVAVTVSTFLFWRLVGEGGAQRRGLASALFVLGGAGDLFIGRVAFALGVTFGLASVLAIVRGSRFWCGVFSLACAAASPVAAAFLVMVAAADLLSNRVAARAVLLAGPPLALMVATLLLFPEGGYEPFSLTSLLPAIGACAAVLLLVPREQRLVRSIAALYALALLFSYLLRSPMGSNAVRFGILFGPAALAGWAGLEDVQRALVRVRSLLHVRPGLGPGAGAGVRPRPAAWLLRLVGAALVLWQINGPLTASVSASLSPASSNPYYTPAIRYLESRSQGRPTRIEVPFTSSHWDAAILGSHFALARGWERQVDTRYDSLFYEASLTARAYHAWLLEEGVRFVVLSDSPLDFSSVQEAALIRSGLPFLKLDFRSAHWRIYEVRGAQPLAAPPARLISLNEDGFVLQAPHAGHFLVRVHYTPYWKVTAGVGSVAKSSNGWTVVGTKRSGEIAVDAEFSLF
jgi:hypothetical protein